MANSLDLRNTFPAISDQQWQDLISEDLSWQPIEGMCVQPYYRRTPSETLHTFHHRGWLIRADVDLTDAASALDAGAEALGFFLDEPVPLPEALPVGQLPLFFRGPGVTTELVHTLRERTIRDGLDLGELRGAVALPEQLSARTAVQIAQGTRLWTQQIDLEFWHDRGATHVQELACGLARFSDLLAELHPDCFADHIYFRVPVGERYLLDIARLRALRLGAAQVLSAYQAPSHTITVVGVPSGRYASALDPDTHLVRQTLQSAAAIIGGCDLVVSPGIGHSLRIQQLLHHEGKLHLAADAAAGSWMIEHLTDALGNAAWELFQQIESKGGLQKAQHWMDEQIHAKHTQRTAGVLSGKDIVVGVNAYLSVEIDDINLTKNNLTTELESIRLRAQKIGPGTPAEVIGRCDAWLSRLLELCGCRVDTHPAVITITQTPEGYLAQTSPDQHVLLQSGDPFPSAADRLFKLLETHAS